MSGQYFVRIHNLSLFYRHRCKGIPYHSTFGSVVTYTGSSGQILRTTTNATAILSRLLTHPGSLGYSCQVSFGVYGTSTTGSGSLSLQIASDDMVLIFPSHMILSNIPVNAWRIYFFSFNVSSSTSGIVNITVSI